nr:hypothetical protein CFP56_25747 [Quercus suber]
MLEMFRSTSLSPKAFLYLGSDQNIYCIPLSGCPEDDYYPRLSTMTDSLLDDVKVLPLQEMLAASVVRARHLEYITSTIPLKVSMTRTISDLQRWFVFHVLRQNYDPYVQSFHSRMSATSQTKHVLSTSRACLGLASTLLWSA